MRRIVTAIMCLSLIGCGDTTPPELNDAQEVTPTTDAEAMPESDVTDDSSAVPSDVTGDAAADVDTLEDEIAPTGAQPVANPEAAARAFKLYYKERVERVVVAHQRYGVFGDVTFGTAIDRAYVAIDGDEVEIIGGPKDNNLIGTATWTTWEAYQIFGGRLLELATLRLFGGLSFFEDVSGHPGMTAREVLPGWTRVVDGREGQRSVTRTRDGSPVVSPWEIDADLEAEMIATFWDGRHYTYRENPAETTFAWTPVGNMGEYAITFSYDTLPDYIGVSNCCSSFKQVPEGYPWAGAFWGNHNSRDNFPDLMLGYLAVMEAAKAEGLSPTLKEAAQRAEAAGHRIADEALANNNALMTVDEWNDYETLVVGGTIRPHGEAELENGDLGSMSSCPMAYLSQAMTTVGLDTPIASVPLGTNAEAALMGSEEGATFGLECEVAEGPPQCQKLDDAYCGLTWSTLEELQVLGMPWLELAATWDENEPGKAAELLGGFQNDYDDVVESMMALVRYAQITGKTTLEEETRAVLGDLTDLMRLFADIVWLSTRPDEYAKQRYEAAMFDAYAGREVVTEDLKDFEREEGRMAHIEGALTMGDTSPWPLKTDEEIAAIVGDMVAGEKLDMIVEKYQESYGDTPPIRRTETGYEARGFPLEKRPWVEVENPRHAHIGSMELLQALPLCRTAPHLLDCTWAKFGCAHVDHDGSGEVTEADRPDPAKNGATDCTAENDWCDGADLDQTGTVDATDTAFFDAAMGCTR
ncbi:MAG: hypothetical protein ACPGU1_11160 [Myxococcota bacterium]